jgi:protein TonB
VEPDYSTELRKKGVQGVVVLEGIVATDGTVVDIRVLNSPADALTAAALAAARQYLYKPGTCEGRPVRVYVTLTMNFRLGK